MLFVIGTLISASVCFPAKSQHAQEEGLSDLMKLLTRVKRSSNTAAKNALFQALFKVDKQETVEEQFDGNEEEVNEEDDQEVNKQDDLMAAIESLPEEAQVQFFGRILRGLFG